MALMVTPGGRCLRVVNPDYVYHKPCPRRVKLAAVKHQIYHPSLPTFRTMERDDMMHKLADEHCRTMTSCTRRDIVEASMNPLKPATMKFHCIDITDTGRHIRRMFPTMEDIQANATVWSQYREKLVTRTGQQHPRYTVQDVTSPVNLHFDGVAVRYFKSGIRNRQLTIC